MALPRDISSSPVSRDGGRDLLVDSASPAMARVLQLVRGVAPTPATVLLTGESGTGKEVLARLVHRWSPRAHGAFVAVNCGALPESLVEGVLFGHERGAFSGATERRIGRIEAASGGTLLLDEVSEMPLALQTRLLRVLQEREVHRVGAAHPVSVDLRVIATTNRDLPRMVAAGEFREDLFYRLAVFPLAVPPLRERPRDVPALAAHLLGRHAARFGCPTPELADDALDALVASRWPGNVRQLSNVLERALVLALADGGRVVRAHLRFDAGMSASPSSGGGMQGGSQTAGAFATGTLRDLERERILAALREADGNRTHAARVLGIPVRTLRHRLAGYRAAGHEVPGGRAGRPAKARPTRTSPPAGDAGGNVLAFPTRGRLGSEPLEPHVAGGLS